MAGKRRSLADQGRNSRKMKTGNMKIKQETEEKEEKTENRKMETGNLKKKT